MQKTTQLEITEIAKLVTILKESKQPVPREKLLEIVSNKRTLTRRLTYITETFTNLYLLYTRDGYRLVNRRSYSSKTKASKQKTNILHIGVDIYSSPFNGFISAIEFAKSRNRQLEIKGYKSVSSNTPKDYTVSVVDYDFSNDPFIYATTKDEPTKIKTFKLSRANGFNKSHLEGFAKGLSANKLIKDDFAFIVPTNATCKIATLLMTAYSAIMLAHDFPHLSSKLTTLSSAEIIRETANGINYEYIYKIELNYINIKPLGRVVSGLLDHIKVIGKQEVINELRDFISKTVFNSIERNL